MLAFPQSSFPPQVPVKLHVPVCRPFTLNTCTHVWEHPCQRRWKPGTPRADWREAWGMDSPTQMCSVLPQAKISVSLSAWQHIYIVTGSCVTPPKQEVGCHVHRPHGLCTDKDWLTTHLYFVNLFNLQFLSLLTFNINCFLHAPFQDVPNLMTREKQVDKVKVCGEPDFFPCMHRPRGLWTWQPPLPVAGSHTGTG